MTLVATPAHAATNPYTAAQACHNDWGGSWVNVSDGHRTIVKGSTTIGNVYLMYNSAAGTNCVAVLKAASVGTATYVSAELEVQGGGTMYMDYGNFKYYDTVEGNAAGKCVKYRGFMDAYVGGRDTWGNCG
ncbi:hypothetical protein [Dactylosporangium cerinum]